VLTFANRRPTLLAPAETARPGRQMTCQVGANMIVLGPVHRHQWDAREQLTMPSLFRLLAVIAVLGAAIYGGLYALSHFVQPKSREITVSIPPDKFFKNR
jgi:hypothetical protein